MRLFHRLILFFFTLSQLAWTGTPETNRTLRVGVYENPPMSFYEDGVAQGFVIDLLESIAEEEDWELDYVPCQWSQCLEMLETGEIDLLGPIAYSQERAEQFAFNEETYFTNWGAIYAQPGQEIETFLDLDGIPLAVLQDDIFTTSLKNLLGKLDIQPEYLEVGNYSSVLEAVDSGAAQAGLVNRLFGRLHAQDYNFIETPILFHPIEVRFAAPKESDPEILTIIDNYLDNWKSRDHSPYTQALDRWLTVPQPWRISARLKWALIALIGGLLGFLGIALGLRWLVKKRTNELKASQERHQALLAGIPDLLFIQNQQGTYLDFHAPYPDMLFAPPEEFLGKTPHDVFPEEYADWFQELITKAIRTNENQVHEYELPIAGQKRYLESRIVPFAEDKVLSIIREITARKEAEEKLAFRHQLWEALMKNTHDLVYFKNKNHGIIMASQAYANAVGFEREELLEKNAADLWPHEAEEIIADERQVLAGDPLIQKERKATTATGESRWYLLSKVPIFKNDEVIGFFATDKDITKYKQIEKALRESENRYRSLFENAPIGICSVNQEGQILETNACLLKILGSPSQEATKRINALTFPPLVKAGIAKSLQHCFETRKSTSKETLYESKWGKSIHAHYRVTPNHIKNGQVVTAQILVEDITERKQAEETSTRLYKETQQLATFNQNIIENMDEGIVLEDADGFFTFVNPAAAKLLGYMPEKLTGLHWTDIIPADQHAIVQEADKRRMRGESDRYELELKKKDGERLSTLMSGSPRFDGNDRFLGAMAVFTDITERVQAVAALRASENRYRQIFETNQAIKLIIDHSDGKIKDANKAACEFYGYDVNTLTSMRISDINTLPEEEIQREMEKAQKGERARFNFKHRLASGEIREVEVYSGPFQVEDKTLLYSIIQDVTARKEMEKQLRQQEQLAAVGQLAAGIAHDFRNRLTSTILYAGLILRQTNLPPSQVENLKIIIEESEKASGLVQQILDFGRRSILQVQTIDLRELTQDLIKVLKHTIPENIHLLFSSEVKSTMPFTIEADSGRIEQVLINLATNARDAMPQGGELHFTLSQEVIILEKRPL